MKILKNITQTFKDIYELFLETIWWKKIILFGFIYILYALLSTVRANPSIEFVL